jgi:hypothetical protein
VAEEKHGTKRRRAWRKLHLATDADTGHIVASVLTDKEADDGSQVGPLLDRVDGPWRPSPAMAPTTATTSTPRSRRGIPMRPSSSRRARARCRATPPRPRRRSGRASTVHRRARPHGLAEGLGYNWRALVEADIARWKCVIGDGLRSQTDGRQATEVAIAADVLNRMLELGRPEYVRIA